MKKKYEMLPQQRKIWDIQRAFPGTDICNIGGYLELEGKYDTVLLQKTMEIFTETQSSFWTRVDTDGKLYFEKMTGFRMQEYDLLDMEQAEIDVLIRGWICEPFELYRSPLFDFRLLKLKDKSVVFEKFHHVIADGYAVSLCAKAQEQIYESLQAGETVFDTDESYVRRVMEQEEAGLQEMPERDGASEGLRFVSMERKPEKADAEVLSGYITSGGMGGMEWYPRRFDYEKLREFCRAYRVSVEACVYGCLGISLCRARDGDALAVARNLLNRSGAEMGEIALKVDTLTYAVKPDWEISASEYLADVKRELAVQVRQRSSCPARADIEISYRPVQYLPSPKKGECREYLNSSVELPVKLFVNDDGREIELQMKYQKDAIGRKEAVKIIRRMLFVLEQILEYPDRKVKELSLINEEEREIIGRFQKQGCWNYTLSLPERFLHMAKACPERTALIYRDHEYTYARMKQMTDIVRGFIRDFADQGAKRLIGLCIARSPWMPAAVYGAWLSGYGFLPVSPKDSKERKKRIARKCALFLTDGALESYAASARRFEEKPDIRPDIPAYEIYTSGTTGEPKVVMISHRSLSCRLEWMEEQFRDGLDMVLQKTRSTFDVSVWELALPFAFGKTMCVLEDGDEASPEAIVEAAVKHKVTMVHFVPSMFAVFLEYLEKRRQSLPDLNDVILSGEAPDAGLVRKAADLLPQTEIYNLYGPAECTIDVSCYRCSGKEERIPLGFPVYNTQLSVRNAKGELLPVGETGELVIQGSLVGIGYDQEEDGREGGYCEIEGRRAYRTGDMAVLKEDGLLYYEGRRDRQIKIRGMRVNQDEIERSLNSAVPGTRHMILCISDRLIDFYQGAISETAAEQKAADILPYYCVPSEFIHMKELPVGKHGKADRDALKEEYRKRKETKKIARQEFSKDWELARREKKMLALARRLMGKREVTLEANLFDLGMDSLTVLRFLMECEESGLALSYAEIYENPTIRKLAKMGKTEEPLVFFGRKDGGRLILMVPFAGGTPLSGRKAAQCLRGAGTDFAVVNLPRCRDMEVREAVEWITGGAWESGYQEIYIVGSCVGSGMAIELASRLGRQVKGLMLCESLPYIGTKIFGKVYTFWDFLSDRQILKLLRALRGKYFEAGGELLACFKSDVRKSSEYLREAGRLTPECRVALVFGGDDRITAGYRRKYRRWRQWIAAPYRIYTIAGARHFLTEDYPEALAEIIRKEFFSGTTQSEKHQNDEKRKRR